MTQIKQEFENYLEAIILSYPKPAKAYHLERASLNELTVHFNDYYIKSMAKMRELVLKYSSVPVISIKKELLPLIVDYHCKIVAGD